MNVRPLTPEDLPSLEALLMCKPAHNLFHLSALREHGLARTAPMPQGKPWAYGAFDGVDSELAGVVMAFRGTGSIYHEPGNGDALNALAGAVLDRASAGSLSLLSGHA